MYLLCRLHPLVDSELVSWIYWTPLVAERVSESASTLGVILERRGQARILGKEHRPDHVESHRLDEERHEAAEPRA